MFKAKFNCAKYFLLIGIIFSNLSPAFAKDELRLMESHSTAPHEMRIYDNGLGALNIRLKMIERAKESINVEYFIYDQSPSSRIFNQALAKKAKEGVKVQVLLDYFLIIPEIDVYHALKLEEAGIEVKYYNAGSVLTFLKYQYRSHRKMLSIDGKEALTGGRNIADEYFDLSAEFNFIDKDVWLKGPIVSKMDESFEVFWKDELSQKLNLEKYRHLMKDEEKFIQGQIDEAGAESSYFESVSKQDKILGRNYKIYKNSSKKEVEKWEKARKFLIPSDEDKKLLAEVETLGGSLEAQAPAGTCNDIIFASDYPGTGKKYRKTKGMRGLVNRLMLEVKDDLVIDSPYFITDKESRNALKEILKKGKKVSLLTNSLYSTDAIYVNDVFNSIAPYWIKKGVKTHVYAGFKPQNYPVVNAEVEKARFGTHVKAFIYDHKSFMIGTYNFDPRSTKFNSELGIFCFNAPELAKEMRSVYDQKLVDSVHLDSKKKVRETTFRHVSFAKRLIYIILKPFALLFRGAL